MISFITVMDVLRYLDKERQNGAYLFRWELLAWRTNQKKFLASGFISLWPTECAQKKELLQFLVTALIQTIFKSMSNSGSGTTVFIPQHPSMANP